MDDWVTVAIGLLANHPAVTSVRFAGSRSRGTHDVLSDWDFAVETSDFNALVRDLPGLVAPLQPLGQQWEPLGHAIDVYVARRNELEGEFGVTVDRALEDEVRRGIADVLGPR